MVNVLSNEEEYSKMAQRKYPYGKGDSAEKIVKQVLKFLIRKKTHFKKIALEVKTSFAK